MTVAKLIDPIVPMFAGIVVLSLALLCKVRGSRLGSPKDDETDGTSWAFQNGDRQHAPPGHLVGSADSTGSEHAWAGNRHQPEWKSQVPRPSDDMPLSVGAGARKVLQPEKDEDMAPDVVAKYDTKQRVTSHSAAGTSADLQGTLEQDCRDSMTLKDFMPKCLKHIKSLITDLDYNYGDAQLETILRNWCQSAKEFPNARGTQKVIGFRNHQSCTDFADDLKNARYSELKTTSDKGYRDFCVAFYDHHGGFAFKAPPRVKEEPRKSSSCWTGLSMVVTSLMLCFV